jgi:hypothetical protein
VQQHPGIGPSLSLTSPSEILHPGCRHSALLEASLPRAYRGYSWTKVFCLGRHGAALETLISRCREEEVTLIVMQDDGGTVFGGFVSERWAYPRRPTLSGRTATAAGLGASSLRGADSRVLPSSVGSGYYGNGQSFVFSFADRRRFNEWRWRQLQATAAPHVGESSPGLGASSSPYGTGLGGGSGSGVVDSACPSIRLSAYTAAAAAESEAEARQRPGREGAAGEASGSRTPGKATPASAAHAASGHMGHVCRRAAAAAAAPHATGPGPTAASVATSVSSGGSSGGVHFSQYKWSRRNKYFQFLAGEGLAMGGGGTFAWFLDADLCYGASGLCDTFLSPPLSTTERFTVIALEVWACRRRAGGV